MATCEPRLIKIFVINNEYNFLLLVHIYSHIYLYISVLRLLFIIVTTFAICVILSVLDYIRDSVFIYVVYPLFLSFRCEQPFATLYILL